MLATNYVRVGESMAEAAMRWLRQVVTEELTDAWAEALAGAAPPRIGPVPVPRFILARVIDWMLPERALDSLELVLRKFGLLPRPTLTDRILEDHT